MRTALFGLVVVLATLIACSLASARPTWPPTPVPSGVDATSVTATPSAPPTPTPTDTQPPAATLNLFDLEQVRLHVIEAVNTDPGNFGGVYLDGDGTLVILFVGANAGRARVDAVLAPGVAVRWLQVERSQADLMTILHAIRSRNLDGVVALSLDTINNQIEVLVSPSEHLAFVSRTLDDLFGDAVRVVTGPPPVVH